MQVEEQCLSVFPRHTELVDVWETMKGAPGRVSVERVEIACANSEQFSNLRYNCMCIILSKTCKNLNSICHKFLEYYNQFI